MDKLSQFSLSNSLELRQTENCQRPFSRGTRGKSHREHRPQQAYSPHDIHRKARCVLVDSEPKVVAEVARLTWTGRSKAPVHYVVAYFPVSHENCFRCGLDAQPQNSLQPRAQMGSDQSLFRPDNVICSQVDFTRWRGTRWRGTRWSRCTSPPAHSTQEGRGNNWALGYNGPKRCGCALDVQCSNA